MQASAHNQPDKSTATGSLLAILAEMQRKQNARQEVLEDVARSLDSVVASCGDDDKKSFAREITKHFSTYLNTALFAGGTLWNPSSSSGTDPTNAGAPLNKKGTSNIDTRRSYASAAASGNGASGKGSSKSSTASGAATSRQREDLRLLVRVADDNMEWAKKQTNFTLRSAVVTELGIALADIPDVYHTATGFAIRPRNAEVRERLLQGKDKIGTALRAVAIDLPTKWYNYVVPEVPVAVQTYTGEHIDVAHLIDDEVLAQTGRKPVSIRPSRQGVNPLTATSSWTVSFLEKLNKPFRLFGVSSYSRLIEKKAPPSMCEKCQGFHSSRNCTRTPRCAHCGFRVDEDHQQPCQRPEGCANCYGPHPSTYPGCPARPTRRNGKLVFRTRKELGAIRMAGSKLYRMAHPPEGAEGPATNATSSQPGARPSEQSGEDSEPAPEPALEPAQANEGQERSRKTGRRSDRGKGQKTAQARPVAPVPPEIERPTITVTPGTPIRDDDVDQDQGQDPDAMEFELPPPPPQDTRSHRRNAARRNYNIEHIYADLGLDSEA